MSKSQKSQDALGNTKPKLRCRKWCMTLNNYTEDEYNNLVQVFTAKKWTYVIGKEVGESGTPHLQIFISSKNQITFECLKKLNERLHIEKARGDVKQNLKYCSKDGDYETNIPEKKKIKDPLADKNLYDYQNEILNIIKEEPDDRKIYWYWDPTGNIGKTSLAKHICLKYPKETLFLGGKGSDIKYGVKSFIDNEENELKTCIFHFTRSVENFVSYEALESIKDGIFYNAKYESGMVLFNNPHVICFANFEPCRDKLSLDRWEIRMISMNEEIKNIENRADNLE